MYEQPTTDANIAKIIDKVEKMLRLAANAGTEEEAATAANMAQEYLAAYNLTLADVDINKGQGRATDAPRIKEQTKKVALYQWQRTLWKAIAEANYCYYRIVREMHRNKAGHYVPRTFHHYIIGSEANVVTTRLMGEYLEQSISRLCPFTPGKDSSRSWNSWKEGCATRLAERLQQKLREMIVETRKTAEAAASTNICTAISLVDVMQREDDLNYAAEHGEDALARRLCYRTHAEGQWIEGCETCENRKRFTEQVEKARELPGETAKLETEAQRRKREEKQARESARYWAREEARRKRHWAKRDMAAYEKGTEAAEMIGLNTQVGTSEQKKIGGGE